MPDRLNHSLVRARPPPRWLSTTARPARARPIRIRYSISAMPTWVFAVSLIPTTAMISITTPTALPMAIHAQVSVEVEPNTARTEGPSSRISATVPMM